MKTIILYFSISVLTIQITFAEGIEPIDSDSNGKREVSSLEHLLWIASTAEGLTYDYEQTANIDASSTQYWDDSDDDDDGMLYNDPNDLTDEGNNEGWSPIGDNIDPFTGSYDGQDYIITGLTINRSANFQGLFGKTDNATIENLGFENGSISGNEYAGGLAGAVANSTVANCYNTGSMNGDTEVGGLIGRVNASSVSSCHTSGNVSGYREIGGLVGQNSNNSLITGSYASGQINGTYSFAGGLAGSNYESTIDSCYALGNVNGWHYVGGLSGNNNLGMISKSFASGTISGTEYVGGLVGTMRDAHIIQSYADGNVVVSANRGGGLIGDVYNASIVSNSYSLGNLSRTNGNETIFGASIGYAHADAEISYCYSTGSVYYENDDNPTDKGFIGLDEGSECISNFWDSQVSNQMTATGAQGKPSQDMKIQYFYSNDGWDFIEETTNGEEDIWDIATGEQASYPFLSALTPDTLPGLENIVFAGGDGSPENPYQIENLTHLKNTRYNLNASYIQIADIDASETSSWDDGNGGEAEGWLTIGYYYSRFTGSYNGKNHVISGLSINRPGTGYQGLFGYLEGANIDSLGIEECNISGKVYVGALVAYIYNNSLINNCYSTGNVSAYQDGGGLLGQIELSELKQSFSTANVFVERINGGGLIGTANNGSLIKNCYSRGNVTRTGNESSTHFGAFAGACSNVTIEKCYTTGSVFYTIEDDPDANGFVVFDFENNFLGNFWDSEVSNQNTATGATSQTTANMKTQSTFTDAGWDFMVETANGNEDHWGINNEDNDGYPFLKFQGYKLNTEVTEWPVATNLECGQTLGESALTGGSASVEGHFAFTNPDEVAPYGTFDYEVAFYPTDAENYETIFGSVSVTVEDNIDPEITSTHSDQEIYADDVCEAILPDYTGDVVATDNCNSELIITQSPVSGTIISGTSNVVSLTVSDEAGNTAEVTFNVTVIDNSDPEITSTHNDQIIDANETCEAILPDYTVDVIATDNCDSDLSVSQSPDAGTIISGTSNVVSLTVSDEAGNTAEVMFNVTVMDNSNPEITSIHNDQIIDANETCEAILPDYTVDVIATDNCDSNLSVSQSPDAGTSIAGNSNTVILTVTDNAGNTAEESFNISVEDNIAPTITCPDDIVVDADASDSYAVTGTIFDPVSFSDNCSIANLENNYNSGSSLDGAEFPVGNTTVIWTVSDDNGNETSCSFVITVNSIIGITNLNKNGIRVFPNPAKYKISIESDASFLLDKIDITLTDVLGKTALKPIFETYDNKRISIDITDLEKGIYFLTIHYDKGLFTKMIIKE